MKHFIVGITAGGRTWALGETWALGYHALQKREKLMWKFTGCAFSEWMDAASSGFAGTDALYGFASILASTAYYTLKARCAQ